MMDDDEMTHLLVKSTYERGLFDGREFEKKRIIRIIREAQMLAEDIPQGQPLVDLFVEIGRQIEGNDDE